MELIKLYLQETRKLPFVQQWCCFRNCFSEIFESGWCHAGILAERATKISTYNPCLTRHPCRRMVARVALEEESRRKVVGVEDNLDLMRCSIQYNHFLSPKVVVVAVWLVGCNSL